MKCHPCTYSARPKDFFEIRQNLITASIGPQHLKHSKSHFPCDHKGPLVISKLSQNSLRIIAYHAFLCFWLGWQRGWALLLWPRIHPKRNIPSWDPCQVHFIFIIKLNHKNPFSVISIWSELKFFSISIIMLNFLPLAYLALANLVALHWYVLLDFPIPTPYTTASTISTTGNSCCFGETALNLSQMNILKTLYWVEIGLRKYQLLPLR